MYPFGIPLVHRGVFLFRIADGDKVEGHKPVGNVEYCPDGGYAFFMGIDTGPDSAKTYGMGGEKNVLGSSRQILHP